MSDSIFGYPITWVNVDDTPVDIEALSVCVLSGMPMVIDDLMECWSGSENVIHVERVLSTTVRFYFATERPSREIARELFDQLRRYYPAKYI